MPDQTHDDKEYREEEEETDGECDKEQQIQRVEEEKNISNATGQRTDLLDEEGVNNFLENDKIVSSQGASQEVDNQYILQEGMQFTSSTEAHKFFNDYARLAGFVAVIAHHARTQRKKRNNEVIRITYRCNRQGQQQTSKEGNTQEEEVTTVRDTNVLLQVLNGYK